MQPSEISGQLPNGFHGAFVELLRVDYRAKTAEFLLQLLVPMDKANPHSESRFRSGRFRVSGLAFLSADVPDPQYDFIDDSPIELGSLLDSTSKIFPQLPDLQSQLGNSYFFHSFFVEQWNGFIHFSGTDAAFQWIE
jgi:hypothetical protein